MKRLLTASLFAFALVVSSFAQDRAITILNFDTPANDETAATLTHTMKKIIESGILYIGTFRVQKTPSFRIKTDKASLREYTELTGSEYILFGSLTPGKNGTSSLEGCLYSRVDDSIFRTQEELTDALSVFGASDSLSLTLLSELHKMKISYGSLSLKVVNGTGSYDVYVNGVLAGSNAPVIANIPDGYKTIRVVARSGQDDGKVLFSDRVLVKADAATPVTVDFRSPGIAIAPASSNKGKTLLTITSVPLGMIVRVDDATGAETPLTVEVAPGAHKFEPLQTLIENRYYAGQPIQWVTVPSGAETVIPVTAAKMSAKIDASSVLPDYAIFADGREIPAGSGEPVDVEAGVYTITVKKDGDEVYSNYGTVYPDTICPIPWGVNAKEPFAVKEYSVVFKSKTDFWSAVKPVYAADKLTPFAETTKYSVRSVSFARDSKYFYWHVEFNETNPLASVPPGTDGDITFQLTINAIDGKLKELNFDIGTGQDKSGYYDRVSHGYENLGQSPSTILTENSITGRIALSTLSRWISASVFNVDCTIASNNWAIRGHRSLGYVDFGFLKDKK